MTSNRILEVLSPKTVYLWWAAAIAFLAAGCAHSERAGRIGDWLSPRPPSFLSGPMAVLLTNTDGFSAHVVMETRWSVSLSDTVSGELLGRGSKLLFEPKYEKAAQKNYRVAGLSFLWDVAGNGGYVLSEALQAYAPMASDFRATNILFQPNGLAPEKVDGHACEREQVTLSSSDGSTAVFEVWKALDSKAFPLRISAAANSAPTTLQFSKFRLGAPPAELFRLPDGFTHYESAERMMGELATRQANLKRTEPSQPLDQPIEMPNRSPGSR